MFRRIFVVLAIFILTASLTGCGWMTKTLNPTFSTEFAIVVSSTVEHPQVVYINGVKQDFVLSPPPGELSHRYVVNIEAKDLDYWGPDGNQDQPIEALGSVSAFDLVSGIQSRQKPYRTIYDDRDNFFNITDSDFR